jgi:hypothetical protein
LGPATYALTDHEKTVSVDQVCGIAVRNPRIVSVGRHYGFTVATCVPADPESKGGSEATVRIARADLVPTEHNLRTAYDDVAELDAECEAFCDHVNARERGLLGPELAGGGAGVGAGARLGADHRAGRLARGAARGRPARADHAGEPEHQG